VISFAATAVLGLGAAVLTFARGGAKSRPLFLGLVAGYAVVFGLVPAVSTPPSVAGEVYDLAGTVSLVGMAGLLAGWHFDRRPLPARTVPLVLEPAFARSVALFCTLLALTGFLLIAMSAAGSVSSYLAAGRFSFRGTVHPVVSVGAASLIRCGMAAPLALQLSRSRVHNAMAWVYAIFASGAVFFAFKGTRSTAIGILGAAVLGYVWRYVGTEAQSFSARRRQFVAMMKAGVALLVLVLLAVLMYEARKTLNERGLVSIIDSTSVLQSDAIFEREPFTYSTVLYVAVDHFPDDRPYMWLAPLRRTLFAPLPTGGLKPEDPTEVMGQLIRGVASTVTVPPSLPGEGYIALGGSFGAGLWLLLYGLTGAFLERRARTSRLMTLFLGTAAVETALLTLRGQLYEQCVRTALLLVLLALVDAVSQRMEPQRAPT
jgi:hypothetical protein